MHFSEDDLKRALRRKDPGPGFTQRVMARVNRMQEAQGDGQRPKNQRQGSAWIWRLRPVLAGALAAVLLVAGGLGYQQYERVQDKRRADERNRALAKQQMMLALKITNAKLNHVFRRVSEPSGEEPKIRRRSL
jgi:hypothetical protein